MQLLVHRQGTEDPEIVEVDETTNVATLLRDPSVDAAWIADEDEALDASLTLKGAGVTDRAHLFCGRCRSVTVTVRFNGENKERSFKPSARISRIHKWAVGRKGFDLGDAQGAKHMLAVPGDDHFLDGSVHVGSLVSSRGCQVVLDLLPRERNEG